VALVALIVIRPFVRSDLVELLLGTLVLVSAVTAVGGRRRTLTAALLLLTPALAGKWVDHLRPDLVPAAVISGAEMAFIGFVIFNLLRFVLRAPRVDSEILCAALSVYLMLGLVWAIAYELLGQVFPDAFAFSTGPSAAHSLEGFSAFYFSFVTLSTVGYGDIAPVSEAARMLAVTEAITGTLYVAVLIARLVSLYSSPARSGEGTVAPRTGSRSS